jgi:hypothetical protein
MPTTTPQVKVNAVKARGGANVEVVLHGDSYTDAYNHALMLEQEQKLTFVHPFDDPDVIAGQGTIGMEILRQHSGPIHAIFVPIGGGGLIRHRRLCQAVRPDIKIIGVQTSIRTRWQAASRPASASPVRRRPVLGRHRGAPGGRGNLPPRQAVRGRDHPGRHRRHLRRDQGRVPGYAQHPGAGRRAGRGRRQGLCRARATEQGSGPERDPGGDLPAAPT